MLVPSIPAENFTDREALKEQKTLQKQQKTPQKQKSTSETDNATETQKRSKERTWPNTLA